MIQVLRLVLLSLLVLSTLWTEPKAEMIAVGGYLMTNSITPIQQIYNYLVTKSSNYICLEEQILDYDVDISTSVNKTFYIKFEIRFSKMNGSIRDEIISKTVVLKNLYIDDIVRGYLIRHLCRNDESNKKCDFEKIWSKGY